MQTAMVEPEAGLSSGTSLLPLDTLGATIKARVDAGDKATEKAEEHYKSAGLLLIEAKQRLPLESPGTKWTAYLVGICNIRMSRAYELIAVAEGRTTVAEVQAKGRERAARHAAKNKAARSSVSNGQPDDEGDDETEVAAPAVPEDNILYAIQRINENARVFNKLLKLSAFDREAVDRINTAIDGMIGKWRSIQKTLGEEREQTEHAVVKEMASPRKLSPASLAARRKRMADNKLSDNYSKQFGGFTHVVTRDVLRRMERSLKSGVDDFAEMKRERLEAEQQYIREETQRRQELNAPLLAPITPERAKAYTRLITTRTLYEGACDLSWAEYFEYRDENPDLPPLTSDDLEYVGMWTACAVGSEAGATRH
jgi:hypothetical protein